MADTNPYGLPDKQWRFVQEYIIDLNGTAAYQRAGYKASGHAAESASSRLLRNVEVQNALQAEQIRLASEAGLTRATVIQGWRKLERADIRKIIKWDKFGRVEVTPSDQLSDTEAYAITELTHTVTAEGSRLKIKLEPKKPLLDTVAKHLRMFGEDDTPLPDIHVHVHTARERLSTRIQRLAARHAEDATNGH